MGDHVHRMVGIVVWSLQLYAQSDHKR